MKHHTCQIRYFWTGVILLLALTCWRVSHMLAPSSIHAAECQGRANALGNSIAMDSRLPGVHSNQADARVKIQADAQAVLQADARAVLQTNARAGTQAAAQADSTPSTSQTFPAVVKPNRVCTLAFLVGGAVAEVCADVGDTLHAGDALLKLDAQDFERDVRLADANLQAARERLAMLEHGARDEDLAIIEAKLASATAQRDYLTSEYERAKPLQEKNAISLSDLALMFSKVRVADAEIHSLQKELQKARSGGRPEEIRIQKAEVTALEVKLAEAKALLADTTLTAPFDGVLAECLVQPHEIVRPGHAVAALVDVSRFSVEIQIPENEIPQSGDFSQYFHGYVTFPSFPEQQYPVSFQKIAPTADAQTHCWCVTLMLEAPADHVILPGMTCRVVLENR